MFMVISKLINVIKEDFKVYISGFHFDSFLNNHFHNFRKKRADKVVCYGELGCFEETAYLEMLPSSPEEIDTKFYVYSAKHR